LNCSLCIFKLLETKLHYEQCLKNVSKTAKNRYKGNLTMKIDHFYWWSDIKYNARDSLRIKLKKNWHTLLSIFKEDKTADTQNIY
jgi:hypothetical protein